MIILLLFLPVVTTAQKNYLLIGTYTGAGSEGIYVYDFDLKTGAATQVSSVATSNPSYLAVSPDQQFVFAANEDGQDEGGGKVSAFRFRQGKLVLINQQPSLGEHPCYVAVDATGRWVSAGNYSSGSFALLPVQKDGSLLEPSTFIQHKGRGPTERQQGPHVHATVFSPDNQFLYVSDLGTDQVNVYSFNAATGELKAATPPAIHEKAGAGPRHFIFDKAGRHAYLVHELSGTVSVFLNEQGKLNRIQEISSLPDGYAGKFTSADLHLSPQEKFLYVSNRDDLNTLTCFRVGKDGKLHKLATQSTLGKTPRNFSFDPSGKYLLVAHQNTNDIVIFKANADTGALTDTGNRIQVSRPVCLKWIRGN